MAALETAPTPKGRWLSRDLPELPPVQVTPQEKARSVMHFLMQNAERSTRLGHPVDNYALNNHAAEEGVPTPGDYSYIFLLRGKSPITESVMSLEVFPKDADSKTDDKKREVWETVMAKEAFVLREGTLSVTLAGVAEQGRGEVRDTDLAMKDVLTKYFGLPLTIQVDYDVRDMGV